MLIRSSSKNETELTLTSIVHSDERVATLRVVGGAAYNDTTCTYVHSLPYLVHKRAVAPLHESDPRFRGLPVVIEETQRRASPILRTIFVVC